jgi:hypothetical protein
LRISDHRVGEAGDEFRERKLDGIETKVVGTSAHPSPPRINKIVGNNAIVLIVAAEVGQQTMVQLPIAPICVRFHLRLLAAGIALEMFVGPDRAETEIVIVAFHQHLVGGDRSIEGPEHVIVERVRIIERDILDVSHPPGTGVLGSALGPPANPRNGH